MILRKYSHYYKNEVKKCIYNIYKNTYILKSKNFRTINEQYLLHGIKSEYGVIQKCLNQYHQHI